MSNPATTLTNKSIPQINETLKFVVENPYSDFYRNKYKGSGLGEIKSYEDFQKIPFLTKDEILAVPLEKRIFVKKEKIKHYSLSSGTTNKNKPAIIPFSSFLFELTDPDVSKILLLSSVLSHAFQRKIIIPKKSYTVTLGDINNLRLTAMIAKEIGIDGIFTIPTILYFFIEELKKVNFDFRQIKWLRLTGEFCSQQKLEYFKSEFPNAYVDLNYGISEIGRVGNRCNYLADSKKPNAFHPVSSRLNLPLPVFIEIIGKEGNVLSLGQAGEIVCSAISNKAFPQIRYRTNDIGVLEKHACRCGNSFILTLGGRIGFDVLRFYGVKIYAEMIAAAVNSVKEFTEPLFQMHVFEKNVDNKIKPKLELRIKLKKESENLKNDPAFKKLLEEKISSHLKLSAKKTLKQLIDQDVFLPLEIVFVESWTEGGAKTKNIISHLE